MFPMFAKSTAGGRFIPCVVVIVLALAGDSRAWDRLESYYAHRAVEDEHGVIAPWHPGQNGPCDLRVRIAAEIFKRYPWVEGGRPERDGEVGDEVEGAPPGVGRGKAALTAPHLIYNTHWKIDPDGTITIPPTDPWMCGDLSQRALSIIRGLTAHYAYTGDPLAFVYVPLTADYILDWCLTPASDPWPEFPVSTPTRGTGYGRANPHVPNQLDLCALVGTEMVRAWRLVGNPRYLEAARRWGDILAARCRFDPELPPWSRYAKPDLAAWSDEMTAGTILILEFLDELIALGHTGDGRIERARDHARAWVRDVLLPRWTEDEVWGRHYWDWENPVYCGVVPWCCEYFMSHPDAFPDWRTDVRNVLSLVFVRNCVSPDSRGEAYSGAWAFPETSSCCGTSLSYNQFTYAPAFARYGALAGDPWASEVARRMTILACYDTLENGVVLDGIDGRVVAASEWLNLAQPWPLCQALLAISWMPEAFGPSRENRIVRTASVVTSVVHDSGRIAYAVHDAPAGGVDVLRLAFRPSSIVAGGKDLRERGTLDENGYTVKDLPDGDAIVTIRHDGLREVVVEGDDPQEAASADRLAYEGEWEDLGSGGAAGHASGADGRPPSPAAGKVRATSSAGAVATFRFRGNQLKVLGPVGPEGGLADVTLDGEKQLTLLDAWSPTPRDRQVLYWKNGLEDGEHELRVTARGEGNPLSRGRRVAIDRVLHGAATPRDGERSFGAGGGPSGPQRMILGYAGRKDYVDSRGYAWRPATEIVVRTGHDTDAVARTWWRERRSIHIGNIPDPELFRYGVHAPDFRVNVTVAPGTYAVRLLLADTNTGAEVTVRINGEEVLRDLKVAEAAGGKFRALERTFLGIRPRGGIIEVRFLGSGGREASAQAVAVEPIAAMQGT